MPPKAQDESSAGTRKRALEPENEDSASVPGSRSKKQTRIVDPSGEEEPYKTNAVTKMDAAEIVASCIYFANRDRRALNGKKQKGSDPADREEAEREQEMQSLYSWKRLFMLRERYLSMPGDMQKALEDLKKVEPSTMSHELLKRKMSRKVKDYHALCAKVNYQAETHNIAEPWKVDNDADSNFEPDLKTEYMAMRLSKDEPHKDKQVSEMTDSEACEAAKHMIDVRLQDQATFMKKLDSAGVGRKTIEEDLLKNLKRLFVLRERLLQIEPEKWPDVFGERSPAAVENSIWGRIRRMTDQVRIAFELSEKMEVSQLKPEYLDMKRDPKAEKKYRDFFLARVLHWKLGHEERAGMDALLPSELRSRNQGRIEDIFNLKMEPLKYRAVVYTKWEWPSESGLTARQRKALALKVWKRVSVLHTVLSDLQNDNRGDADFPQFISDLVDKESELVVEFKAAHEDAYKEGQGPKKYSINFDCEMEFDTQFKYTFMGNYKKCLGFDDPLPETVVT